MFTDNDVNRWCKTCRHAAAEKHNPVINAISGLARRIAGTTMKLYELPREARLRIRDTARMMYELGSDVVSSIKAESITKNGFVYVITNPAWPEFLKIGRAFDPESRVSQFNVGAPLCDYVLRSAIYFDDCHWAEKEIHARLALMGANGEWFEMDVADAVAEIRLLREII